MDLGTLLGLILAFGCVLLAAVMEGGELGALASGPPALLVFGGTFGATLVSVPLKHWARLPSIIKLTFFPHYVNHSFAAQEIVRLAGIARRKGLLQLESELQNIRNPFLAKGLSLVIDGTDAELIRENLDTEIAAMQERHKNGVRIFRIMGGLSPTLGVIGTVMGLVHMLGHVTNPDDMGPAIAMAFMACLYGVGAANLIFLPIANKLAARSEEEVQLCDMLVEGLMSVHAGHSPMIIEERLKSFLRPGERDWTRDNAKETDTENSANKAA